MPASSPSASPRSPSLSQIEARFKSRIWRGDALGASNDPVISSRFPGLDRELPGGGWPTRNLTELLLPAEGMGEIRLLSSALVEITRGERNILLVAPPHIPCIHAWEHLGIDSRHIVMVRVCKPAERLWTLEQGIRSAAFGTIVCWLPEASQPTTRKLQILSRTAASLVFLFRPARAQFEPSAAPLRILLNPVQGQSQMLSLYLLKRRGAPFVLPIRIALPQAAVLAGSDESRSVTARSPSYC